MRDKGEGRAAVTLHEVVEAFCSVVDENEAYHDWPKTGMQVPYHGDFMSAPPSVRGRLRWWAREMRRALDEEKEGGGD